MAWLVFYPKCVGSLNVCFLFVIFVALVRHIGNMRNVIVNGYELFSSRTFCNSETFNLKLSKTSNSVVCINNEIDCFSASFNFDLFTNFKSEQPIQNIQKNHFDIPFRDERQTHCL